MTTPFRARVRPTLGPTARDIVAAYERTPGSTGPGCCPEALAAVIDLVAYRYGALSEPDLHHLADLLRGAHHQ
jgi:hypothetical protein